MSRWEIQGPPQECRPTGANKILRYWLARDGEERDVVVEISLTLCATDPSTLPSPLDELARTEGRSVVERNLHRREPPARIIAHTKGFVIVPRDGNYEYGDRVYVRVGVQWLEGRFDRPGDPEEGVDVNDPRLNTGRRRSDVALVRLGTGGVRAFRYGDICARPPTD